MSLGQFGTAKYPPQIKLKAAAELELRRRRAATSGAGGAYHDAPVLFIHECVIIDDAQDHGDGMGTMPFHLWDAQKELLEAIETEPRLLILKARQLGITWLVCAYALWLCLHRPQRLVLTFSIGQNEANEMMRRMHAMYWRLTPELRATLPLVEKDNTEEMVWSNGSRIESLPSRKSAGSGYTASLIILDEFAKNENAAALYTAVKPTIDGGGKMIILSTANGAGNLFHEMVEKARKGLSRFAFRFLPWQARPGRDAAWYASVEADAIDSSLMKQEYPATPDEAFEASEVDAFLPSIALWDACQEKLPPLDARTPCILALDAAESNDTFGTVILSKHPTDPARLAVRYVRGYAPTPGVPLDFDAIEQDIRDLVSRYAIQEIVYDPMLLGQTIRRLTTGKHPITAPCEPFFQGAARLESDKGLYDLITQRNIAHGGNEDLRAHVKNANRKVDTESRKLRIVKRTYALKIDLCVALAMGSARAGVVLDNTTGFSLPYDERARGRRR
jgi:hypothetical protein